jgi:uncharacterized RDD family membrane protein YckC
MIEHTEPQADPVSGAGTGVVRSPASPTYPWHSTPPGEQERLARTRPDIQGRRAGLVTRVIANVVDVGVVIGALLAAYTAVAVVKFLWAPRLFHFPAPSFGLVLMIAGAVEFVYLTVAWRWWGRTWGDQLLGLRVVNFRGTRLRWPGAVLRAALCVTVPIGLFWVLVSRENRSLQDVLLRTSVIYDWPRRT